jgi:hypothetical protein
MRAWCVESVSEDGEVVVLYPDGERCAITVPPESVPKLLVLLGVTDAMMAEADRDKWAYIYEVLVGATPPKKPGQH